MNNIFLGVANKMVYKDISFFLKKLDTLIIKVIRWLHLKISLQSTMIWYGYINFEAALLRCE